MANMSLDDFLKRYEQKQDDPFAPTFPETTTPSPKPQAQSFVQAGLQKVEQAGGALLTNTVKGVSVLGQSIMGAFEFLENNGAAMTSGENDKLRGFTWDNFKEDLGQMGQVFGGAVKAGVSQGQRIAQSKNLTELAQNSFTGVDLLKNLPGHAGDYFRNQEGRAANFATGVAGFALEVLLDPISLVGGAAYKGGAAIGAAGLKAGFLGERAGNVIGRAAANAATGNWVGGAIAMTARESSFAAREKLVTLANRFEGQRIGRAAETILEWGMGPMALTTNAAMRTVISKYAALKEDLPKDMLRVANESATLIAHLPDKQKAQAQALFGQLAGATTREMEEGALEKLGKLGIGRDEAASVGTAFRSANLRLIDILQDASNDLPGLKGLTEGMSQYHLRRSYRMFVDPKVREDWLDHLVRQNTPAQFKLSETALGSQLRAGLGLDVDFGVSRRVAGPINEMGAGVTQGTRKNAIGDKSLPGVRTTEPGTINEVGDNLVVRDGMTGMGVGPVERMGGKAIADSYTRLADPKLVEQHTKLTDVVAALDTRIDTTPPGAQLDRLVERRNKFQAQLESVAGRLDMVTQRSPGNEGHLAQNAFKDGYDRLYNKGKREAIELTDRVNAGARLADGAVTPKVDTELDFLGGRTIDPTNTGAAGNFPAGQVSTKTAKDNFLPEDLDALKRPHSTQKELREVYVKELGEMMADAESSAHRSSFIGYKKDENGNFVANFSERTATARKQTLLDLQEWTADWGRARGMTDDQIAELNAAATNSLIYIPGSRDFVTMVREKSSALADLDPKMGEMLQAELRLSKVDASALQDRTLDPVWHDLFGRVDNFSVQSAQQGLAVGEIAARARMLSELKQRGLVKTEQEAAQDVNGGWVPMDDVYKTAEGDGVQYYIQRTNKRAIAAIDRSLGDLNKMQLLTHASNLFRRAALGTDPSAHVTQFLGNLSMLQMMGFKKLFGDDVQIVKGMTQAYKSVMLGDDLFKDAVDHGVMVSQTILSGGQNAELARNLLTLPRIAEANGDKIGALTNIFRSAHNVFNLDNLARQGTQTVAKGLEAVAPGLREGTDSIRVATTLSSTSAMFQLPDQMTRLFAYRAALQNKTQQMVKTKPQLSNFMQDGGATINWKAAMEHAEKINNPNFTPDMVKGLQESHKLMKEESAKLANDVALNYSDVPLAINYLSKTGVVPFIKFQYKATGRIMEFMDERPWAFSPYYAAQRNLNDGMNPDPDNFENQRATLTSNVRDAFVIPTGAKDTFGRQEFMDLSRWLPFGMFASAANGGGQEGGLSMQPSSIVSTPVLDVIHSAMNADQEKAPGQSMAAFMAQKLVETFAPAGIAPGGRKVETLANAIQQSMHYVDEEGNVINSTPNLAERAVMGYAGLPETIGQAATELGNRIQGDITLTTAQGSPKPQTAERPRTTEMQALGRYVVPGYGFSADRQKTVIEYNKRYDLQIDALKRMKNQTLTAAGPEPTQGQITQMRQIDERIGQLEQQKISKSANLLLGE